MTYVGLLRGINVGGKRLAMADLRRAVEQLGFSDARTLLASGNVVFRGRKTSTATVGAALSRGILATSGVFTRVTVLTATELDDIIDANPLVAVATNPSRLLVSVYGDTDGRATLEPLRHRRWAPGALALGPRAAYVWCPDGVLQSAAADAIAKTLKDAVTSRNWSTLTKLQTLARDLK